MVEHSPKILASEEKATISNIHLPSVLPFDDDDDDSL